MHINKRNAKCMMISSELKIFPIIPPSLELWMMVLEAIIIGAITNPIPTFYNKYIHKSCI